MDGYDRGGHSKYSMKVHIIFTKDDVTGRCVSTRLKACGFTDDIL